MVSEKTYWIILIVSLGIFASVVGFVLVPYQIIDFNLGINLVSESFGIVFTIVFLTWIIRSRELRQWKSVEKKVRERIANNLYGIFEDIFLYFLEPAPQMPDKLEKKIKQAERMEDGMEREKLLSSLFVGYYANEEMITLGEDSGSKYLREPDPNATNTFREDFRRRKYFLEHIISEYSKFLPPILVRSIMEIEDGLDEIINVLSGIFYVDLPYIAEFESASEPKKSELKLIIKKLRIGNESRLKRGIHKITQEIYKLNELGLGFYSP